MQYDKEKIEGWKSASKKIFESQTGPFRAAAFALLYRQAGLLIPRIGIAVTAFIWIYFTIINTKISLKAARGGESDMHSLTDISGTKHFIFTVLYSEIYRFVCMIPAILCLLFAETSIRNKHYPDVVLAVFLFLIALLFAVWLWSFVACVRYVSIDHPEIRAKQAMRTARVYAKGCRQDYFFLILSYVPQIILGFVTAGVWYVLFTGPQISIASAMWYKDIGRTDLAEEQPKKRSFADWIKERRENRQRYGKAGDILSREKETVPQDEAEPDENNPAE